MKQNSKLMGSKKHEFNYNKNKKSLQTDKIIRSRSNNLKSLLFDMTRISEWWVMSFGFILFAFIPYIYRLHNGMQLEYIIELFTTSSLYMTMIIVFSAQMFLFASNNYYDRHVDSLDKTKARRNPICTGKVTTREVMVLLIGTVIISLVVAFLFNVLTFLITALALFVFYFYTAEPIRLKRRIGLDVLSHAIFINTFPFLVTMIALWDFHFEAIFLLFVLVFRSATAQILQEIRDYNVDKKVENNTVIFLGRKRASQLIFFFYILVTSSTLIFMITYQLFGFGLKLFFILIFLICILYGPPFYQLLTTQNYQRNFIDKLWVGQGRTNKMMIAAYGLVFGVWFFIIFVFLL